MLLVQLVYFSRPSRPMASRDLMAILETARSRNAASNITGILCYSDDVFLQALEGARDQVCETFYRIAGDDRHTGVTLLAFSYPSRRTFMDWTMGYAGFGEIRRDILLKHAPDGRLASLLDRPGPALGFLEDVGSSLSHADLALP